MKKEPRFKQFLLKATREPLAVAVVLSVLLHLLIFGIVELDRHYHFLRASWVPRWLKPTQEQIKLASATRQPDNQLKSQAQKEIPLLFVDVDPRTATQEEPKQAKYYSALNSQAANPDKSKDLDTPKIDGTQTKVPKTTDVPRERASPLQPSPPPTPPKPQDQAKEQPPTKEELQAPEKETELVRKPDPAEPIAPAAGGQKLGDLALARPSTTENPNRGQPRETPVKPHVRPRTIAAARQLQEQGGLAGQKMQQEGGSKKFALQASFDVRATPFGSYDAAIIAAIQKSWYDLLDEAGVAQSRTGKVMLSFKLKADGSVSDFKMEDYDVGMVLALMCQRAIEAPAPFAPWPSDMKRLVGAEFREVRFTFYYN